MLLSGFRLDLTGYAARLQCIVMIQKALHAQSVIFKLADLIFTANCGSQQVFEKCMSDYIS